MGYELQRRSRPGTRPGSQKYAIVNFTTIPSGLQVSPVSQGLPQGTTATITVTAVNSANQPYANTNLRFTIAGANPQSGVVTTNAQGVAQIHYVGSTNLARTSCRCSSISATPETRW